MRISQFYCKLRVHDFFGEKHGYLFPELLPYFVKIYLEGGYR